MLLSHPFMFFVLVTTILSLIYAFVGWRLIPPLPVSQSTKLWLWAGLLLLAWAMPLSFGFRMRNPGHPWNDGIAWFAYLSMGFITLLASLLLIKEVFWKIWQYLDSFYRIYAGPAEQRGLLRFLPDGISRQEFLHNAWNMATLGLALIAGGAGYLRARRMFRIERKDIPIRGLHPDLDGFRIVQVSDIHIGPTLKEDFMARIRDRVNALKPDLVAVTGDIVDGSVEHLRKDVAPISDFRSRYGSFFVTGNHEYYSGARSWEREFQRLGLVVLKNEHTVIKHGKARLLVGGVTDYSTGGYVPGEASDPHKAMAGAPESDFRLLLAHQPRSIFEAAKAGFDLQLSGHTHGGQYFPATLLVYLFQPFVKGLHRYKNTFIYVNRGTGYWGPPLRLGSAPEISVLTLKRV